MTTKEKFIERVKVLVLENFSISECAELFGIDYRNMCAYMAGRKSFPLLLAFSICDYLGTKVVLFRTK